MRYLTQPNVRLHRYELLWCKSVSFGNLKSANVGEKKEKNATEKNYELFLYFIFELDIFAMSVKLRYFMFFKCIPTANALDIYFCISHIHTFVHLCSSKTQPFMKNCYCTKSSLQSSLDITCCLWCLNLCTHWIHFPPGCTTLKLPSSLWNDILKPCD